MSLRETGSLVEASLKADLKVRLYNTAIREPRSARLSWVYGFAPDTPPLAVAPLIVRRWLPRWREGWILWSKP